MGLRTKNKTHSHTQQELPPLTLYRVNALRRRVSHICACLSRYVRGYLNASDSFLEDWARTMALPPPWRDLAGGRTQPGEPLASRAATVNNIFRNYGHQHVYDFRELQLVCDKAGIPPGALRRDEFRSASLPAVLRLDQAWRAPETLYASITKDTAA